MDFKANLEAKMQRAKEIASIMKNLLDLMIPLVNNCSELVANVGEIVSRLSTGTIQDLKESLGKLNKSIDKVKETTKGIKKALNDLKAILGNKDNKGDGKSKAERVIAKVVNLIDDITNITEQCLEVALQVDLIVQGERNIAEQINVIEGSFTKISDRATHIKDTAKSLINIIKGSENEGEGETSDGQAGDQEDGTGCWTRFKSFCCCCCNPKTVQTGPESTQSLSS